jgi:hypothetical protein
MRVPDHKIRQLENQVFHDGKLGYLLVETQLIQDLLLEIKFRREKFERDWERGYEDYD